MGAARCCSQVPAHSDGPVLSELAYDFALLLGDGGSEYRGCDVFTDESNGAVDKCKLAATGMEAVESVATDCHPRELPGRFVPSRKDLSLYEK